MSTAQFTDVANQLLLVCNVNAARIFESYANQALQVTSYAEAMNATWPFLTIPSFEAMATRVMTQTGARNLVTNFFVQPDQQQDWQIYSTENAETWIDQGFRYQGLPDNALRPTISSFDYQSPTEEFGFYAVVWQIAPISNVTVGTVNLDTMT